MDEKEKFISCNGTLRNVHSNERKDKILLRNENNESIYNKNNEILTLEVE